MIRRLCLTLMGLCIASTLVAACSTTSQDDAKTHPRVQVIGHGTTPGASWAGVGVTVPFPGKSASPSPPSSGQEPKESGKP